MHEKIQILNKFKTGREKNIQSYFGKNLVKNIKICDVYKFNNILNRKNYNLACELLYNPISQKIFNKENIREVLKKFGNFPWILEVGYLPGVTDNLGNTATEIVREKLNISDNNFKITSSQVFLASVKNKSIIHDIAKEYSNSLVNKVEIKKFSKFTKHSH